MRPKWTDTVLDRVQSVVSAFAPKSDSSLPGQDDNSLTSPTSNASRSRRQRAQMPSFPFNRQYKTRGGVKSFLDLHDNLECDPIAIESDEEDAHSQGRRRNLPSPSTRSSAPLPHNTRPRDTSRRTEARDESRLLGGLTRREPDAITIPDPMKKAPFTGGHRPVNTLDALRSSTRSSFVQDRTQSVRQSTKYPSTNGAITDIRIRSNDHAIPSKKRKTEHRVTSGTTSASAISLDDSQAIEDSPDELQLTPSTTEKPRTRLSWQAHHSNQARNSSHQATARVVSVEIPKNGPPSPKNEDDFTKGSARLRKAEKDQMLGSSSPSPVERVSSRTISPYFTKQTNPSSVQRKIQKQDQLRSIAQESPDILQDEGRPSLSSQTPYAEMTHRDLISEIIETQNTEISKPAKGRHKKFVPDDANFNLVEVVYPGFDSESRYTLHVDIGLKTFEISRYKYVRSDDHILPPFSMQKITETRYANGCVISVGFSRSSDVNEMLHLRFESERDAGKFLGLLKWATPPLTQKVRDRDWMETAFKRAKTSLSERLIDSAPSRPKPQDLQHQQTQSMRANIGEKRQRVVDKLDGPNLSTKQPTIISGSDRGSAFQQDITVDVPQNEQKDNDSPTLRTRSDGVQQNGLPRRTTRSQIGQQASTNSNPNCVQERPNLRYSETGALVKPWSKDLVYPKPGKRSATVPFEDLGRLDDDEFLNDNLISFFMQYLETFMERNRPELQKRTYFFNSYFFERLTKNVKGRGINYDAVSRWTKAIDIFNRDFVVVPVNENLHWYLAIVCNLRHLRERPRPEDQDATDEIVEVDGDVHFSDEATEGVRQVHSDLLIEDQHRQEAPTEETQKSLADLTISDEELSVTEAQKLQSKKGSTRRKPFRKSLPKYDVNKPVIITLDSLGASRSSTCSLLKQYIIAEGKSKRSLNIDLADIRGMTAKGIPTQSNFSDCGLYLCMYLEQFVADPYNFVARILQREESAQLWPQRIRSEDLRSRLRELILEVHRRQENEMPIQDLPEVGSIMIQKRDPSPVLGLESTSMTKKNIEEARKRFIEATNNHSQRDKDEDVEVLHEQSLDNKHRQISSLTDADEELEISADFMRQNGDRGGKFVTSDHFPPQPTRHSLRRHVLGGSNVAESSTQVSASLPASHIQSTPQFHQHNTPAELVADLRKTDEMREGRKRRRLSEVHAPEQKRSASASTEFLTGIASYARIRSSSPRPESRASQGATQESANGAVEVSASPEPETLGESEISNSKPRHSMKRKRQPRQGISREEFQDPIDEIPETQESEHGWVEEQTSQGSHRHTRGQHETQGPIELGRRKKKPIERLSDEQSKHSNQTGPREDIDSEREEHDEDLDGEMLLQ